MNVASSIETLAPRVVVVVPALNEAPVIAHVVCDLLSLNSPARRVISDVLVCDNSGSGEAYGGPSSDYADFNDYHFYCDLHNFDPLVDHFRRDWRPPIIDY